MAAHFEAIFLKNIEGDNKRTVAKRFCGDVDDVYLK